MSILLALLGQFWPYLVLIGGGLLWGLKQRRKGRAEGEAKLTKAREKAATELHEMDREATEAERQAAGMSDDEAKEEALKWRKSSPS